MELEPNEAQQLISDFYGCDFSILNSLDHIKEIIHTSCEILHVDIIEECYHKFAPIGISAFAIISTSHVSIHTWPENQYAAVDVFSCKHGLTTEINGILSKLFHAKEVKTRIINRCITSDVGAAN